jgi:hypothetical protein
VPTPERPATLRIELRDHGPAGVFGVRITSSGAEVAHESLEEPDAVLITTTDALLAAFGADDLPADADIVGDPEVVRRLVANVRVPASRDQHSDATHELR